VWKPDTNSWTGQDVFILGGGPSLQGFDFQCLVDELVIGCNDAYKFGPLVCDVCVFGDYKWFELHRKGIEKYTKEGGLLVTNCPQLVNTHLPWLKQMGREALGLHKDALGWNSNTGSSALNLALILGAKRVFLLGFDLGKSPDGKSNWHKNTLDNPGEDIFQRWTDGFVVCGKHLKSKFSDREVFNVTNGSRLEVFPKLDFDAFWKERNGHGKS
jgi:hypothetical protein